MEKMTKDMFNDLYGYTGKTMVKTYKGMIIAKDGDGCWFAYAQGDDGSIAPAFSYCFKSKDEVQDEIDAMLEEDGAVSALTEGDGKGRAETLERVLKSTLVRLLKRKGYDDAEDYVVVQVDEPSDGVRHVQVRNDLIGFYEDDEVSAAMDAAVAKFDKDAYFEPYSSTVWDAWISEGKGKKVEESRGGFVTRYKGYGIHDAGDRFVITDGHGSTVGESKTMSGCEGMIDELAKGKDEKPVDEAYRAGFDEDEPDPMDGEPATEEEQNQLGIDAEGVDADGEQMFRCAWCKDIFPEDEISREKDFGYLCDQCVAYLRSRGEKLWIREGKQACEGGDCHECGSAKLHEDDEPEEGLVYIPAEDTGRWASDFGPEALKARGGWVEADGNTTYDFEECWPLLHLGERWPTKEHNETQRIAGKEYLVVPCQLIGLGAKGEQPSIKITSFDFKKPKDEALEQGSEGDITLTDEQKKYLQWKFDDDEMEYDASKDWVLTKDKSKDPEFDPAYPNILLIGGEYANSYSDWVVKDLERDTEAAKSAGWEEILRNHTNRGQREGE